ncbi:MAG: cytochrome P450, partial [Myxococcales bacterium]|nr:cytochrome P450 [Myxococcales bacterium]
MSLLDRTPRPNGPRTPPGLGITLAYGRDAFATLERMVLEYGPVSYGRLTGFPMLFLAEPEDMEHVLVRNHANYIKDKYLQVSKRFLGEGLLTSEGDLWKRQRRLIQPAFHPQRVAEYGPAMVKATERRVRDWRPGEVRAIDEEMRLLTLDIAVRTLFGSGLDAERSAAAGRAVADLSEFAEWTSSSLWGVANFLLPWVPSGANRRSKRALADLDRIVYGLIEEHRRAGTEGDDVLSRLLKAQDEGGGMSDAQLRDEVLTLFLAGHETTA